MSEFAAFVFGMWVGTICCVIIVATMQVNISDDELYRFCIVRKIPLQDCVIPPSQIPNKGEQHP